MFDKNAAVLIYAVSPLHLGAGTAVGLIDNPIQREKHTGHPCIAGSGLKGAIRHGFENLGGERGFIDRLFGPASTSGKLHAGAVSFGDAQMIAMPVRTISSGFAYVTCPQALARAQRMMTMAGCTDSWPDIPMVKNGTAILSTENSLTNDKLHLEVLEYSASIDHSVSEFANILADACFGDKIENQFFKQKFQNDLIVLSDGDFSYFSEFSMVVEPHVRIDADTGTAEGGGLFFTENLPPESLLIAPLMASKTRTGNKDDEIDAEAVLSKMRIAIDGKTLQVGGDATTGRGLVITRVIGGH